MEFLFGKSRCHRCVAVVAVRGRCRRCPRRSCQPKRFKWNLFNRYSLCIQHSAWTYCVTLNDIDDRASISTMQNICSSWALCALSLSLSLTLYQNTVSYNMFLSLHQSNMGRIFCVRVPSTMYPCLFAVGRRWFCARHLEHCVNMVSLYWSKCTLHRFITSTDILSSQRYNCYSFHWLYDIIV